MLVKIQSGCVSPHTHINMKMNQGDEFLRNNCVIIDYSVSSIFGALLQVSVTGAAVAAIIQVCSIKCYAFTQQTDKICVASNYVKRHIIKGH